MNLSNLEQKLTAGQAALILSEENRAYFLDYRTSDGFLIVTEKGSLFITDSRYIEDAEVKCPCAVLLQKNAVEQVYAFLKGHAVTEVLVEASRITLEELNRFRLGYKDMTWDTTSKLDDYIAEFRSVKDLAELQLMQKAQAIAEKSFLETLPLIKVGVLERDIANELDYRMRRNGADGISFDTIVVSGPNSSKPHGVPGRRAMVRGDFITIDFGAVYRGYHSDTTRTVALGNVSEEMERVYNVVLAAQERAAQALHPGMPAKQYDAVARDYIQSHGYGKYFGHSLGHGVGTEIHEAPFCGPQSGAILRAGNVVSCEPGIYLPGQFGVRIEDMLVVTATGVENFCHLDKKLCIL